MDDKPQRRGMEGAKRFLVVVASLMLIAIVLINGANVFGRYVLAAPFTWAEEVMLYLMVASIFLGAPAVTWDGANIRMDIFVRAMPPKVRRLFEGLADLLSLLVAALLAYVALPIISQLIDFDQRSHAAEIPMWLPQGFLPLGFALIALALIARELTGKAAEHAASHPE